MTGQIQTLSGTHTSHEWFDRAQASLAGGVSSSSRLTSTGPHPYPLYMASGSGTRIRDVDGNEYIDYLISYGSAVLGHAAPELTERSPPSCTPARCSAPATPLKWNWPNSSARWCLAHSSSDSPTREARRCKEPCAPPAATPDAQRS